MSQLVVDIKRHFFFVRIAKINKKIFIPNFINDLLVLPIKFLLLCIVWFAIYNAMHVESLNGFSLWDIILYYFAFATIMYITMYYRQLPFTVWNEVTKGEISKFVCRPISYLKYHFFYGLGYTYYGAIFCLPIIIISLLCFFPGSAWVLNLIFFLVSIFGGIIITYNVYMLIGLLAFWTESIFGYRDLILHLGAIMAGSVIPLSFLPDKIQFISKIMPFRYMVYEPICILFNHYSLKGIMITIVYQIVYLGVISVVTKFVWRMGLRRYEAQGG